MRYRNLGKSGLRISEVCLGTMTFGEDWDFGASKEESFAMLQAFCEQGGNFVDTADKYTEGTSEQLLGEFIAEDRDYFVLSSKYSLTAKPGDPNAGGNHRKNMMRAVEASLKRLQTDYLDVYWLHVWDAMTPLEEIMRGLEDLVRSGKALYLGISDTPAWIVSRANMLAELRGWSQFIALQTEYNLLDRTPERELLPMADALGLGVLAWSPLAGGVLTGKYALQDQEVKVCDTKRGLPYNAHRLEARHLAIVSLVVEIGEALEASPAQVALAWIRQRPEGIIPIIAGRTLGQFRENLHCLELRLEPEQMDRLNQLSAVSLGFPHEFLASEPLRQALFGDCCASLDLPKRSYL